MLEVTPKTTLERGFVLAMCAEIGFSDYARPAPIRARSREWIVVSRWGGEGEYLSVSTAGLCAQDTNAAPGGLKPCKTLLGLLVSESEDEPTSTFLLVRQPLRSVHLAGTFFP